MSTLRVLRETALLVSTVAGATLGYMAGAQFDSSWHLVCAFVGMSVGGGFADFCIRGGKY